MSATMRSQLAGRTQPGKCYRLYADKAFKQDLPDDIYPEILRSNLSVVILTLKKLGIDDFVHFDLPDPPAPEVLMRAIEQLHYLGCIDDDGNLTEIGEMASRFPVEPQMAKMLIESPRHNCSKEALSIAAVLSVPRIFIRPLAMPLLAKAADTAKARFAHLDGDHLTMLNVYHAYKQKVQDGIEPGKFCNENFLSMRSLKAADGIREHLKSIMDSIGLSSSVSTSFQDKDYYPNIRRCLVSGFFMQVAHLEKEKTGQYLTVRDGQEVALHSSTSLQHRPEWVVYNEFGLSSKTFMRTVTQVRPEWLVETSPDYFSIASLPKNEARAQLEKLVGRQMSDN